MDNGKAMFVGGQTTADATSVTNSAELYNHLTGKFPPTGSLITGRQDFAQMACRMDGSWLRVDIAANGTVLSSAELYTPLIADVFSDIPINYWAYDYIMAIYNAQITAGCSQEPPVYCPEDNVTREQMAVFIIRAMDEVPPDGYCGARYLLGCELRPVELQVYQEA